MFYVYTYTDPNTSVIFYIGKGQDYRCNSHLKPSFWKDSHKSTNPFFYGKIKKLMMSDNPPIIDIIKYFDLESDAYEYESNLIGVYKTFNDGGPLLNISKSCGGSPSGQKKPWSEERKKDYREMHKENREFKPSYEELYELYIIENLSRKSLSRRFGVTEHLLKKRLQEYNLIKPTSLVGKNKINRVLVTCNNCLCEKYVVPSRSKTFKFCSQKCSYEFRKGKKYAKKS